MNKTAQHETPQVGIFWVVQATEDEARLLAAGCPLDQAEAYGDCLTYGPGHFETQSMIDNGLCDEGYLVTIAPGLNYHVQDAAEAYYAQLRESRRTARSASSI